MIEHKAFDVSVGSGIISIFQRKNFKLERVFSEFIDNSLQSYLDHQEKLKSLPDGNKCVVSITWDSQSIVIRDNAFGMNEEEFGRSLKLKATNPNAKKKSQLGVYGMGLKYASASLGDCYSISTTAYNSPVRYCAKVDIRELEKNNPETLEGILSDAPLEAHETEIKIINLRTRKTAQKENDLRQKLGIIYHHYFESGDLVIVLNKVPINYQMPEIRPDGEGGQYYRTIDDSFFVAGKKYCFTGWIGILKKGDQDITGFSLVQANRCIELGYRPEKLFGKGNSFQRSRVFGEIVFDNDNYVLSFDKDAFVWTDDGAEDAFITALKNNLSVSEMIKKAKNLRYTDDGEQRSAEVARVFSDNPMIKQGICAEPNQTQIILNSENFGDAANEMEKKEVNIAACPITTYRVEIGEGRSATLEVHTTCEGENDPWVSLAKKEDAENVYLFTINDGNSFFTKHVKKQVDSVFSESFAIVLATAMLQAQDYGLKLTDSGKLLERMNAIMGSKNDE